VYQGASLTKLFRVKKFIIKDANVYPIEVSFDRQAVDSEGNSYTKPVTRVLFNSANPYPQKKLLTFNRHSSDFDFAVSYGNVGFLTDAERKYLGPHNLTKVRLEGVEEAIRDNPEGDPDGIKVHFRMDESGLLLLDSMESLFQYPVVEEESTFSKLKNAFSNFFTGSEEEGEGGEKANASVDSENNLETEQEGNKGNKEENIQEKSNDDEQQKQDEQKLEEPQQENTEKEEVDKEQVESEEKEKEETDTGEQKTAEEEEVTSDDKDKEEEQLPLQEEDVQETVPSEEEEVNNQDEEGEETSEQTTPTVDSNATNSSINETTPTSGPVRKATKVKKDGSVKMQTVKVNLTSLVTLLDLIQMSDKEFNASRTKLDWLQKRDEDKRENERQKNNLESHIFETQDKMHSEEVQAHSTEEERTSILDALRIASEWMDDDGYAAETDTYRQKLRELKRLSKPVFRRMNEAKKRPRVMAELLASLNRSYGMVMYMKNISEEEIFTKVEMKTLEDLTLETLAWYRETEGQFNDTKPYQDPPVLSSDVEEKTKKLDREVYYLINKIKNYRPKTKPKDTGNTTSSKKPFKSKPVVINGTTDTDEEGTADTGEGTMDSADTLNDETPVEQPIPDTASSSEPIKDDPDDVSSNEDRAGLPSSSDEDHQEL
jgi:hypoxia up-regulated 1